MRLVGPAGEQVGIVRIEDALRLAAESDLDLVEVAPQAKPPVAKLMDFGKYKYEAAVKAREARKNQTNTVLKEIRFRLKIDTHDYETKRGHAMRFLGAGDKVKAMIQFRGREQQRPEMGIRLLQKFADDVAEVGIVESSPRIDGRNMVMVIGPTKNKAEAKAEARRETQRAEAKAANEVAKAGGESKRVDTSGSSGAPLTQSLADLLPEGYEIRSAPEPAKAPVQEAPEAPVQEAAPAPTEAPVAPAQAAPARHAPARQAPRSTSSAPRSTAPRSTSSRPAAERPAPSRSSAPAARSGDAAPTTSPEAAPAPKPAVAAKPMAMPKPGAPRPPATPKPAGRTAPSKSPTSRPKPGSTD
ncbi:translation initiation factor IF-3 [Arthrobacter sp. Ld5]|uniref:translation initiation factor IF-3 n=1 Tax=Arthrobacter sp. Ld5 TaxID=649152 RepID=UPI003EC094BF